MDRLRLLSNAAHRTRTVNRAFGSQLSPSEIESQFADEDIDLLILWMEQRPDASS